MAEDRNLKIHRTQDDQQRTAVVTGASSGIGRVFVERLAEAGYEVWAIGRDEAKLNAMLFELNQRNLSGRVHFEKADLSSMSDTRRLCLRLFAEIDRLDLLMNNAGLIVSDRVETKEGLESTFAVNHLASFLITKELSPLLKKSASARVITTSSRAHRNARFNFDDLQMKSKYSGAIAYCNSKLANIWFTRELARRLEGSSVVANCFHPGVVRTGFAMDGDTKGFWKVFALAVRPFLLSAGQGAETGLFLATDESVKKISGEYFYKKKLGRISEAARSDNQAARLWDVSEEILLKIKK